MMQFNDIYKYYIYINIIYIYIGGNTGRENGIAFRTNKIDVFLYNFAAKNTFSR